MEARVAVSVIANKLTEFAGRIGVSSELGRAIYKAAGILAKAVPAGSIPPGAEMAQLQKLLQAGRQNAANTAAMRQAGAPPGGGAAPGAPPSVPRPPGMPPGMSSMAA